MKEIFRKLIFYRTIYILWWISSCEMSQMENLRRNQDGSECMSELVSRKLLSDNQFTASSYYQNGATFQPRMARLLDIYSQSSPSDGRAWCPETDVYKELTEWLEIDMGRMIFLKALYTMGRGDGNFKKFTPEIVIRYQRSETSRWITYHDEFNQSIIEINTDSRSKQRTSLRTIVARKIRIYPLDTKTGPKPVCLKIAFLGCYFDDEIVSYSAPDGDQGMSNYKSISLKDTSYDGLRSPILQNGLGLLTDNMFLRGPVNMNDYINTKHSPPFIGWKCSKARRKLQISLRFYFDQERIFSEMSIYFVTNAPYDMILTVPLVVSIGYDNDTHRYMYNKSVDSITSKYIVIIPLPGIKGNLCVLNISCGVSEWIALSEIQIRSNKSPVIPKEVLNLNESVTTSWKEIVSTRDSSNSSATNYVYLLLAIATVVLLVLVLLCFMAFLFYKMKRLKNYKVNKKLQFVANCNKRSFYDPSPRIVFTMQSKRSSSVTSAQIPAYYPEPAASITNVYGGSQPSDGVYASWPNTDDDGEMQIVDKEEEEEEEESCLLVTDQPESKNVSKDYAVYQTGQDYIRGSRSASITAPMSTVSSVSEKVPLSSVHLKKAPSFDLLKSNSMLPYRNFQNVISLQHLVNYRGICGDVDFRYQSLSIRPDQQGLDSDIKIISTSSMAFVQPWTRGQYGAIDVVNVSLDHKDTRQYFMKKIHNDAPLSLRSKFIMDLKVLSSLNLSGVAQLVAIVVDCDLIHNNIASVIRSGKFSLLVEHSGGFNLKGFLRSLNYPQQSQKHVMTLPLQSQYPMSTLSMLSIIGQISAGLKHLEDLDLTHRDVGCRNCMIDSRKQIKLYPGGYVTTQPFEDYCSFDVQNNSVDFPLRWLAPESIYKGLFTSKSDVWSFGVTMWEVFTMCSIMPYTSLINEALLELMTDRETAPRLPCPQNCPRDLYDLMAQCWSWEQTKRPSFADISIQLQMKTKVVATNTTPLQLPTAPPP